MRTVFGAFVRRRKTVEAKPTQPRTTRTVDTLREESGLSLAELEVICGSCELTTAYEARFEGDHVAAVERFTAASRSVDEAVAAFARLALVDGADARLSGDQIVMACDRIVERFGGSEAPVARMAAIRAVILASQQSGVGVAALREAAARADADPACVVAAATAHLALAQWWAKHEWLVRREDAAGAERHALEEYDVVISRRAQAAEPALQTQIQFALDEKAAILVEEFDLGPGRITALATGPADRVTPASVLGSVGRVSLETVKVACEEAAATPLGANAPAILRAAVAEAWVRRASVLYEHEDTTDGAVDVLTEFRERFHDDPSPHVQRSVKQGRELENAARHEHRHAGRFRWTSIDSHADIRMPFLGERRLWGRSAWAATAALMVVLALLGLWPVSRRVLEVGHAVQEGRDRVLQNVSTIAFCVVAGIAGVVFVVGQAGRVRHGKAPDWRRLGIGLLLAFALAGMIYAGGRITALGR